MPMSTVLLRMLYSATDLCLGRLGLSRLSSFSAKVISEAVDELCLVTVRQQSVRIPGSDMFSVHSHNLLLARHRCRYGSVVEN